jgi:hypothetical protein
VPYTLNRHLNGTDQALPMINCGFKIRKISKYGTYAG